MPDKLCYLTCKFQKLLIKFSGELPQLTSHLSQINAFLDQKVIICPIISQPIMDSLLGNFQCRKRAVAIKFLNASARHEIPI